MVPRHLTESCLLCAVSVKAAGTAAALAVKKRCPVRDVDVKLLQSVLKENNAFIGV